MIYVFYTVHVTSCLFLIMVVLLQQGKGADLSVFGGGSTQAAFGARGAATLLHKLTVGFFIVFIVTTLSIALLQDSARSESVLTEAATEEAGADEAAVPEVTPEAAVEAVATSPAEDSLEVPADAVESPIEAAAEQVDEGSAEGTPEP